MMANNKISKTKIADYPKDHLDHELVNPPSWWESTQQAQATTQQSAEECVLPTCPKTEETISASADGSDTSWFASHIMPLGDLLMGTIALGAWGYGLHEQQKGSGRSQPTESTEPLLLGLAPTSVKMSQSGEEDKVGDATIQVVAEETILLDIHTVLEYKRTAEQEDWVDGHNIVPEAADHAQTELFYYSGGDEFYIPPTEPSVNIVI